MSDTSRTVVLNIRDDDGVDAEYSFEMSGTTDTTTEAIDIALRECEYEIVGLERVEYHAIGGDDE